MVSYTPNLDQIEGFMMFPPHTMNVVKIMDTWSICIGQMADTWPRTRANIILSLSLDN